LRRRIERIYHEHRDGLFALALSVTREPSLAEDAVHDAVVRVARRRRVPGDPVAYVFAAVRNAAIDCCRRRQRTSTPPPPMFNGVAPDPAAAVVDAEVRERLQAAIDALPDAQREAVVLKTFAGLTHEQDAQVTGDPVNTVASRYRRALATLRESMETPS